MEDSGKNYTEIQVLKSRVTNVESLVRLVLAVSAANLIGIIVTVLSILIEVF